MSVENTGQQESELLRAFLCHASEDKEAVRELYARLCTDGFAPWLDEEDLLPGQDWELEVRKAVRGADVVLVCLSSKAVSKRGFIQKEIKFALDVADEQPEGAIFVIPVRLEACDVPERLKGRHWVDLFGEGGYERLQRALLRRAEDLGKSVRPGTPPPSEAGVASDTDTFKVLGDWLAESRSRWSSLVGRVADQEPAYRLPYGLWQVGYMVLGEFEQPSLPDLMTLLERVRGHESGWPPWFVPNNAELRPYPYHGAIECWLGKASGGEPGCSDFWRASPCGLMYLLRGYEEDGHPKDIEPGTVLDLTLPVLHMGECLLHAQRLAATLAGDTASLALRATWERLSGRVLKAWHNPHTCFPHEPRAHQSAVASDTVVAAASIPAELPCIVGELTLPLYEVFDFEKPPSTFFERVLKDMWKRGDGQ